MELVLNDEKISAVHEALLMLIVKGVSAPKKIQTVFQSLQAFESSAFCFRSGPYQAGLPTQSKCLWSALMNPWRTLLIHSEMNPGLMQS